MERVRNDERQGAGPLIDAVKQVRRTFWPVPGGRPVVLTPAIRRVPSPNPPPQHVVQRGIVGDGDPNLK